MPSSAVLRKNVVDLLFTYSLANPDDYHAYMTAASVGWWFRDSPTGMTTVNQTKVASLVHTELAVLCSRRESNLLDEAHQIIHTLGDILIQKLKDKGVISADDNGFKDDEALLSKHANDFEAWSQELATEED